MAVARVDLRIADDLPHPQPPGPFRRPRTGQEADIEILGDSLRYGVTLPVGPRRTRSGGREVHITTGFESNASPEASASPGPVIDHAENLSSASKVTVKLAAPDSSVVAVTVGSPRAAVSSAPATAVPAASRRRMS